MRAAAAKREKQRDLYEKHFNALEVALRGYVLAMGSGNPDLLEHADKQAGKVLTAIRRDRDNAN